MRSAAADTQVPGAAHHFAGFLSFSLPPPLLTSSLSAGSMVIPLTAFSTRSARAPAKAGVPPAPPQACSRDAGDSSAPRSSPSPAGPEAPCASPSRGRPPAVSPRARGSCGAARCAPSMQRCCSCLAHGTEAACYVR